MITVYALVIKAKKFANVDNLDEVHDRLTNCDTRLAESLKTDNSWVHDPLLFTDIISIFNTPGFNKTFTVACNVFINEMIKYPTVSAKGINYLEKFLFKSLPKTCSFCLAYQEPFIEAFGFKAMIRRLKGIMESSRRENVIPIMEAFGEHHFVNDEDFRNILHDHLSPKYSQFDYAAKAYLMSKSQLNSLPGFINLLKQAICETYRVADISAQHHPSSVGLRWLKKQFGLEKVIDFYDIFFRDLGSRSGDHFNHAIEDPSDSYARNSANLLLGLLIELDPDALKARYPDLGAVCLTKLATLGNFNYTSALARAYPEHKRVLLSQGLET